MIEAGSPDEIGLLGQIALLALSVCLAIGFVWMAWRLSRRSRWITRILIGLGVYLVATWVAPQVYYTAFQIFFADLPARWVIAWPPDLLGAMEEMAFTAGTSIFAIGRGVLGWVCVLVPLLLGRFVPPVRHH